MTVSYLVKDVDLESFANYAQNLKNTAYFQWSSIEKYQN
jgi:hypothetical protein